MHQPLYYVFCLTISCSVMSSTVSFFYNTSLPTDALGDAVPNINFIPMSGLISFYAQKPV